MKSIYIKLYVSFILIFIATLVLVLFLSAHFYGEHLRYEISEYSLSEARFFRDEFVDKCGVSPNETKDCRDFLQKINAMGLLRFWLLSPQGRVLFGNHPYDARYEPEELSRAAGGEEVLRFGRRGPPRVLLPVLDASGRTQTVLLLQRNLHRERFPRFPLGLSLLVAGGAIALMIWPLSRKITRQIRELHGLARKWSEGHLEERAEVHGADEIAELGTVFNSMAGNLQQMLQQKKEFLALISHELKSPVARMRIAAELMADKHEGDSQSAALIAGMQKDLEESEKMIEQLLIISRIEMSMPSAIQERVDVTEVLRRSADQVKPLAGANNISVDCKSVQPPPVVLGDPSELQRALANVLENAVKFSASNSKVQADCLRSNGRIQVAISDFGVGIPAEDLPRIFEPFYRGKTARGKEGSGLGLFLARKIVEQHGGSISASSNTTGGTIITITLPEAARTTDG